MIVQISKDATLATQLNALATEVERALQNTLS